MKLKFDENLDARLVPVFTSEGHEVDTVWSEGLIGADDDLIYQTCRDTGRVLITLDLDFSNPFRFPPESTEGIIVVRPSRAILSLIRATVLSILPQLASASLVGTLWIVEPGRIRVYQPGDE